MNSAFQSLPPLTSVSNVTRIMVATSHFLSAAVLIFVLLFAAKALENTQISLFGLGTIALIILPLASIHLVVGFGILRWNRWSRQISLWLNWINIVVAVLNIGRHQVNIRGGVGVVLSLMEALTSGMAVVFSLFVVWWLTVPAVKTRFKFVGGKEE